MEGNKQAKMLIVIGILTFLVLIFSATYAYFAVSTVSNFGTARINATAGRIGDIVFTGPTSNIHLSVSGDDMMSANSGKLYYATDDATINRVEAIDNSPDYVQSVLANTKTVANIKLENDSSNTDYKCTFDLNMNVSGDMKDRFKSCISGCDGEFYLYNETDFNAGLTEYLSTNDLTVVMGSVLYGGIPVSGTYPITVYLNGAGTREVDIGISFFVENNYSNQSYLAGTTFSDQITVSNLTCNVVNPNEEKIGAPGTILAGTNNISSELHGGMYRYEGNVDNNYICFGTDNVNTCTSNPDYYMYRILGITANNQLKLVKDSVLLDADGYSQRLNWSDDSGSNVTWPNSNAYNGINGNYFLTNTNYVPNSTWSNKIAITTWKYGDTRGNGYSADVMYSLENNWSDSVNAKVGMLYMYDYLYGIDWLAVYNITNNSSILTMDRVGMIYRINEYSSWHIGNDGMVYYSSINGNCDIRPVFYLTNGITLTGNGTSSSPYIIN